MPYREWSYFRAIVENKSITKAANKLYISQPSLSKYLSQLEKEMKIQLIDRSSFPIKMTPAGEIYYRYILKHLELDKHFQIEMSALRSRPVEKLRIGIGNWRGTNMLPELLPFFMERYPWVDIQIIEGTTLVITDAVLNGEIDLCIISVIDKFPKLTYSLLGSERILLVGGNNHPFVKKLKEQHRQEKTLINIDIIQLKKETLLLTTKGQNFSSIIEDYFEENHMDDVSIMRIENLTTAAHLAAKGKYFSFIPETGLRYPGFPKNATFFTIGNPFLSFDIAIAYKAKSHLSWTAQIFIDTTEEFYRNFNQRIDGLLCQENGN